QPPWPDNATRIVTVQKHVQAIAPAFLMPVTYAGRDFILKELQPVQDRLDLASVRGETAPLSAAIETMGQLVAWSALRGSGWQGSASVDDLIRFAEDRSWVRPLLDYVEDYTPRVIADWRAFRNAWQDGARPSTRPAKNA